MRVFVLGTVRCGASTFVRACHHLTNFSAGRSPAVPLLADPRFAYPDQHIEVDPRLAWFLGPLSCRYPDAVYVHLRRRDDEVIESLMSRAVLEADDPLLYALQHEALVGHGGATEPRREAYQLYLDTIDENAAAYLGRRSLLTLWLHEIRDLFPVFLDYIGAKGDLAAAVDEWSAYRHVPI